MNPTRSLNDDLSPRDAVDELDRLCDELERRQVPADQVEAVRALSARFLRHLQGQCVFWERLRDYARGQML